jgi:hypothetical protein
MSWLKFLNMFILQWFFIRLARIVNDNGDTEGFTVIKWIVPGTGWVFMDYLYVDEIFVYLLFGGILFDLGVFFLVIK